MSGTLYGIGVGPGDPELLTLKAVRLIQSCPVVAYPANPKGHSQARTIAARWLNKQRELPLHMPFERDRIGAEQAHKNGAQLLSEELTAGQDIALLCEGDPLLFGSFIHLQQHLSEHFPCTVIPGISSVSAAAAAGNRVLASLDQGISIVPATAGADVIRRALAEYAYLAILKTGRQRPLILQLLRQSGRLRDAVYVEQVSREEQRIVWDVQQLPDEEPGPYFALFLVSRI